MSKNTVHAADLRPQTDKELEDRVLNLRKKQFNLRFQRANGQLQNTAELRSARREIARVLTVVAQRQRKVASEAAPITKTKK
jgi:large subunit ribosomal protein L29